MYLVGPGNNARRKKSLLNRPSERSVGKLSTSGFVLLVQYLQNPLSPFQVQLHTNYSQLYDNKHSGISPIRDHMYKRQQTFSWPSYISTRICYSSGDRFGQAITFFLLFASSASTFPSGDDSWTTKGKFRVEPLNVRTLCFVACVSRCFSGFPRINRPRKVIESARGASAEGHREGGAFTGKRKFVIEGNIDTCDEYG